MSTTSPNFNLVLATSADTVSVTSHLANNFSLLDSIIGVVHTGTGQLKSGLVLTSPTLASPTMSGTASGANLIAASTGRFSTITATGGPVTVSSLNIGTYSLPTTASADNTILTVITGNAVWAANSPGTGAATNLANLASVAINTSLNTFTAGFVTVARVIATSGALTGLTSFQATAGTFVGAVTALGTINANVLNVTGGAITAGGITVGTFALPGTIASTGVLRSLSNTATWYAPTMVAQTAFSCLDAVATNFTTGGNVDVTFLTEVYDLGGNVTTGVFTAPSSGVYNLNFGFALNKAASTQQSLVLGVMINTTARTLFSITATAATQMSFVGALVAPAGSGEVVKLFGTGQGAVGGAFTVTTTGGLNGYFTGVRLYEF